MTWSFWETQLTVNLQKTKIVIFRRGGRLRPHDYQFKYGNNNIEVAPRYVYLGIPFSASSLFYDTAKTSMQRAKAAIANVMSTLANSECVSWEARLKLYDSIILNSLLYASPVWSLRYFDEIERVQLSFFKQLLQLPKCTPGYFVRLECGLRPVAVKALYLTLVWWRLLQRMNERRLPRLCYDRLANLASQPDQIEKYNWALQLKYLLRNIGCERYFQFENITKSDINTIVNLYSDWLFQSDINRAKCSSFSPLARFLVFNNKPQPYLSIKCSISFSRAFAQIRSSNKLLTRIVIRGVSYTIDPTSICTLCNLNQNEDLVHLLLICPLYSFVRNEFFAKINFVANEASFEAIADLLSKSGVYSLKSFFVFIKTIVCTRSFVLNE